MPLESQSNPGPDLIDIGAAGPEQNEAPKEIAAEPAPPQEPDPREQEIRRKKEVRSYLASFFRLKKTDAFSNEEIIATTKEWSAGIGINEEKLAELLDYFERTEKIFDQDLALDRQAEVASALAEIIADNHLDAETVQALVGHVEYDGTSGEPDVVARYDPEKLGIIVYDELWQKINGAPQNIVHILKHEIAHGLSHWAEVGRDTETQAKLDEMIADANGLKSRESYRSVNAINQFLDKKQDAQWLSKEILAEKIAAYLESAGNFGSFIEAQLLATPWENVKIIFDAKNSEVQDRWLAENRAIFDQIDAQMRDKANLKEKILASTEEQRAEIESHYDDDDFDWDYFLGGGISEPGIPDNTKSPEYRAGGESMLADLARLADAVGSEVEKALPITELKKAA